MRGAGEGLSTLGLTAYDLAGVKRHGKCVPCRNDRNVIIGSMLLLSRLSNRRGSSGLQSLGLELTRDPPTGAPLPLPTERQWKEGLRWQRR